MKSNSRLEKLLEQKTFVVTGECGPPKGPNIKKLHNKTKYLENSMDAVNVTDNQTAVVHVSSLASCLVLKDSGIEPIYQITTRDRNRIALQSDIAGAAMLGIKNILCLSGDHQIFGNHPGAKNVFDIDSIQLVHVVKTMRDEGRYASGSKIKVRPQLFIGAASNPFSGSLDVRVLRLGKKIKAGADFIQTQPVFNMDAFQEWMEKVRKRGLHEQVHIIVGVMPLKSAKMIDYLLKKVPGTDISDDLQDRIRSKPKPEQGNEGIKIASEQIKVLKDEPGVHGIHLMTVGWESKIREIMQDTGLHPRPSVD